MKTEPYINSDTLKDILHTDDLSNYKVELLFDNYNLINLIGEKHYSKFYIITNKNFEKSILEIRYEKNLCNNIKDVRIMLPFEKRKFSIIKGTTNYILTISDNGSGIFSLGSECFILKEGKIPDIIEAEHEFLFTKEIFKLTNSSGKKGVYVPSDKKLSIPVQYDEINRQSEMYYCPTPNITVMGSEELIEGTFFTRKQGKIGLYSFRKDKHYRPKPDDVYDELIAYNHISRRKIPNGYDKMEFFSNKGIFKIFIEETPGKYKEGLLNIYWNKIIVPPIFDKIESFNQYDNYDKDYPKNFIGDIGTEKYIINTATSKVYKITRCEMPLPENYQEIERKILDKKEPKGKSRALKK